ncbi:permease [Pseudomonas tremae]|uniref:permease n=1 Tax=Pseudomonas syringae group TaxID=136849 RepID=UPI000EFE3F92|nr:MULTISPECIES: permease [Pseudomonas syringae group]MCQ2991375.1 permease [Pseudomonas tremae]RMS13524.1 Permease of the major facilitator superfamily [Pseudomonas coronafaciens pv. coronafaciens]RMV68335.1 Permease of the major facilitator superfamily [Pseudomonas coronafaciens pv. atropurpurea]
MTQQEKALDLPKGNDILNWKIKTIARPPKEIMITQLGLTAIHLIAASLLVWGGWDHFLENSNFLIMVILMFTGHFAYYIGLLIRQKTIYNYTLKTDGATVEYYLHYPDFASSFFKGIAISVILIFVFIALLTGSLLFLIGPVAMAVIAAVKLLNWENPVHHRQTAPWHLHEFVTVDHKRLMIIIHCDDVTTGFPARFPSKELMNKYLAFLHEVLPESTEYTEKASNWK